MIGIIVQLFLSWIVMWLFNRGNLSPLGLQPSGARLKDFMLFFFITAACSALAFFLRIYFGKEQWLLNPRLNASLVVQGTWQHLKSILFEELIFRGVLLYLLIKKLGMVKAVIISACCFGIYHWFSYNLFGNIPQMMMIFCLTGIMGMLLAYGYAITGSLYVPIAIHLAWNLVNAFVFSQKAVDSSIFIPVQGQPEVSISQVLYYAIVFLPKLSTWGFNFLLLKQKQNKALRTVPISTGALPYPGNSR